MFFSKYQNPKLAIVIPCYNEQEVLIDTINRLLEVLSELEGDELISDKSFLYLVDDGSGDNTFNIISVFNKKNKKVKGVKFTKNFGNQSAILAGMLGARDLGVDCVITIDADLQQDENVIKDFVEKYKEGYEVVFGVRQAYKNVGFFKRLTSAFFYKFTTWLGAKIIPNHSEYRLVGKKGLDILSEYKEYNLFLRTAFTQMGLKSAIVPYNTKERKGGKTKFNWASLMALGINGVTSFSIAPLRFVAVLGILLAFLSFAFALEVIWEKYYLQNTIPGWTTIVVCVCFFSGIQIFCLGIIGEYLGQIFAEVKARPRYIKDVELL